MTREHRARERRQLQQRVHHLESQASAAVVARHFPSVSGLLYFDTEITEFTEFTDKAISHNVRLLGCYFVE